MTKPRLAALIAWLMLLTPPLRCGLRQARANDERGGPSAALAADSSVADVEQGLAPPPGDPWYSPQATQRGPRTGRGEGLVFKDRITPHWFRESTRFWYRNDLSGGAKEF